MLLITYYAVELRDEGSYAFLLPESEIKPVEEEMFAALKKMADHSFNIRSIKTPSHSIGSSCWTCILPVLAMAERKWFALNLLDN